MANAHKPFIHRNYGCCTPGSAVIERYKSSPSTYVIAANPYAFICRSSCLWHRRAPVPSGVRHVSTVPLEFSPPAPEFDFRREITRLKSLRSQLASTANKESVLNLDDHVRRVFLGKDGGWGRIVTSVIDARGMYLLKCLVAAGQAHVLGRQCQELTATGHDRDSSRSSIKQAFHVLVDMIEKMEFGTSEDSSDGLSSFVDKEALMNLLRTLDDIERFYDCIGGIIGYQIMVLELLCQSMDDSSPPNWSHSKEDSRRELFEIHVPKGLDLSENADYASQAAIWGIDGLPVLGEIYPLGGSADRLGLVDPDTGECLPAAMLPYCGRTLLEGLIRDIQAREFLYFKLYDKQCITPIAIMTSKAKKNHERIASLFERHNWFDRGRSSFRLFEQPLVPAISSDDGQWLTTKALEPVCKPGGHGVIWKLAYNNGIFDWFYNHGRKAATVRQVSNVVAATDVTLLALAGIGLRHNKKLGFASCERISGATEGINVLLERSNADGNWSYGISCIEYTKFDKYEIATTPSSHGLQPPFPANTNILFVDLKSVEAIVSRNDEKSLPGMLLNTSKPISFVDCYGQCHSINGGRLECTMQNIADNFLNTYAAKSSLLVEDELDTFLVYNERRKVTSSAKKKRKQGDAAIRQTPEGSFLDILRNAYDLLSRCNIDLPEIEGNEKYADSGPPFLILLHPALGPLWEVTRQKFNGGFISRGSEVQIEASEFLWKNVRVDGSLAVIAENAMGSTLAGEDGEPIMRYGHRCGRCRLENVNVVNKGVNWGNEENVYWKNEVQRLETCRIILRGNAEYEASDVTLSGDVVFDVPSGYKMVVTSADSGVDAKLYPLDENAAETGSWRWSYRVKGSHIHLELLDF